MLAQIRTMKTLLLRSLLAAVLIGPLVAFVSTVASVRTTVKFEPGLSQDELGSYDNRTVADLDAFFKSRAVKFTRSQWLRESHRRNVLLEGNCLEEHWPFHRNIPWMHRCWLVGTTPVSSPTFGNSGLVGEAAMWGTGPAYVRSYGVLGRYLSGFGAKVLAPRQVARYT